MGGRRSEGRGRGGFHPTYPPTRERYPPGDYRSCTRIRRQRTGSSQVRLQMLPDQTVRPGPAAMSPLSEVRTHAGQMQSNYCAMSPVCRRARIRQLHRSRRSKQGKVCELRRQPRREIPRLFGIQGGSDGDRDGYTQQDIIRRGCT